MKMIILFITYLTLLAADDGFSYIQAEVVSISIVAILLYVIIRLKTILSKRDGFSDK